MKIGIFYSLAFEIQTLWHLHFLPMTKEQNVHTTTHQWYKEIIEFQAKKQKKNRKIIQNIK